MSKIELDNITSGYNLGKINANFVKIENALTNNVLFRDATGSTAGPNQMVQDIDMDSQSILNLPTPTAPTNPVRLQDLGDYATSTELTEVDNKLTAADLVLQNNINNANILRSYGDLGLQNNIDTANSVRASADSALDGRVTTLEQGTSGTDLYIHWLYNDGLALGGEVQLNIPYEFTSIATVYINGVRMSYGLAFDFDVAAKTVQLAEPLETGDEVVVSLGTEPQEVSALIQSITEEVTLTNGQTIVTFVEQNTNGAIYYINGPDVDSRFLSSEDFTASSTTSTTITLTESYPAGSIITLSKNVAGSGGIDGDIRREFVHNEPTLVAATASTLIREGDAINIKERTTGSGDGAMWDVVVASTVVPNGVDVVVCTGVPTLALVLRTSVSQQLVDLFISVGQSNAEGRGNLYQSPDAPHGLFINSSTISDLADPVGGADNGSMWPEFTNEWFNQSGRISAVVDSAVGGTSLLAAADPSNNWSSTGDLRGDAVVDAQAAITAINNSPLYQLGNVYFIWLQGEKEALNINGTTITGDIYEQELEDLSVYFDAQIPEFTKMGVILIATSGAGGGLIKPYDSNISGFEEIRLAQKRATDDSALMELIYTGTSSYLSLKETFDGLHYNQDMLNKTGRCAAKGLRRPIETANISPFLGSANAVDPDTGNSSSRTLTHETSAFTETLIVALSYGKATNTNAVTKEVTFNGIPMLKVAIVEDKTNGIADATLFILTKQEYGRSLDRVTGDIVVTTSSAVNFLSFTAIDATEVCFYDSIGGLELAGATATASAQTEVSTYMPSLTVTVGAYVGDSATAITGTMTNSTKLMDTGISNGARNEHALVGYSVENSLVEKKAFSTTTSAVQTEIALLTCSFRPVIKGEIR